jgi:hypothetical protein
MLATNSSDLTVSFSSQNSRLLEFLSLALRSNAELIQLKVLQLLRYIIRSPTSNNNNVAESLLQRCQFNEFAIRLISQQPSDITIATNFYALIQQCLMIAVEYSNPGVFNFATPTQLWSLLNYLFQCVFSTAINNSVAVVDCIRTLLLLIERLHLSEEHLLPFSATANEALQQLQRSLLPITIYSDQSIASVPLLSGVLHFLAYCRRAHVESNTPLQALALFDCFRWASSILCNISATQSQRTRLVKHCSHALALFDRCLSQPLVPNAIHCSLVLDCYALIDTMWASMRCMTVGDPSSTTLAPGTLQLLLESTFATKNLLWDVDGFAIGGLVDRPSLPKTMPQLLLVHYCRPLSLYLWTVQQTIVRQAQSTSLTRANIAQLFDLSLALVSFIYPTNSELQAVIDSIETLLLNQSILNLLFNSATTTTTAPLSTSTLKNVIVNFLRASSSPQSQSQDDMTVSLDDNLLTFSDLWMYAPIEWMMKHAQSEDVAVSTATLIEALDLCAAFCTATATTTGVVDQQPFLFFQYRLCNQPQLMAQLWFTVLKSFVNEHQFYLIEQVESSLVRLFSPLVALSLKTPPDFDDALGGLFESFYTDLIDVRWC